ncbi:MAG: YifB family Mg chelatase-like AAA ATPase, partial [Enterobacterales bacterium]|nr:YifB family Mg chelatase-like AAA ATPase [Enterobacterales bacterium]
MAYAQILSRGAFGIDAPLVQVEVHLSRGLPAMSLVGLAGAEVKESKERVRSAIINSGFEFPAKRITINLAPADLPKAGGRFDLAIAMGILVASGQAPDKDLAATEYVSELSLDGRLKAVQGVLLAATASQNKKRQLVVAPENLEEATLSGNEQVITAATLQDLVGQLFNERWQYADYRVPRVEQQKPNILNRVKGNEHALRALLVAASGGHNLLMVGSPGSGKTMMASGFPELLPELSHDQAREVAQLESVSYAGYQRGLWHSVRVRAPHHSCSSVAMVGGGKIPTPGEISLAHHGVLFLDELPEFKKNVLEVLRQPLEDSKVTISRSKLSLEFPPNVM